MELSKEYILNFQVLTKDSVTVSVDAVVYYRVSNATVSIANVENAHHSTRLLAQTTLRNIMGQRPLHEILSERESISQHMKSLLDEATDSWGINVERVEMCVYFYFLFLQTGIRMKKYEFIYFDFCCKICHTDPVKYSYSSFVFTKLYMLQLLVLDFSNVYSIFVLVSGYSRFRYIILHICNLQF